MGKISVKPWHAQPTTRVNRHFSLGPQQCRLNRVILYINILYVHMPYSVSVHRSYKVFYKYSFLQRFNDMDAEQQEFVSAVNALPPRGAFQLISNTVSDILGDRPSRPAMTSISTLA